MIRSLAKRFIEPVNVCKNRYFCLQTDIKSMNNKSVQSERGYKIIDHPITKSDDDKVESNVPTTFAVIKLGGTQYKITKGDVIVAEKLPKAHVGETLKIHDVLLVGSINRTLVGMPIVENSCVHCRVEEQTKDRKIDIFKKKRRKNYRRWNGFRREVTLLRVLDVESNI